MGLAKTAAGLIPLGTLMGRVTPEAGDGAGSFMDVLSMFFPRVAVLDNLRHALNPCSVLRYLTHKYAAQTQEVVSGTGVAVCAA